MNTKTLLKLSALLLVMLFVTASAFAQGLATVYVDVTNGSNTYTGANSTNSPAGTGPVATINKGLSLLADNGTLVIFAGTYVGGDGASADVDINTTTYTRLVTGLTIESRALGGNNTVSLSAGNFIYNVSGGTLTINATNSTETFSLANNLTLGSTSNSSTMAIPNKAFFTIASSKTITIYKTSAFSNQGPTKGTNLSLQYLDSGSLTAGQEANQTSFGTGTLTVNKTAGTVVTFPYAMTFTGSNDAINITSGDATFAGAITLGSDGSSGSTTGKTADIVVGAGASTSSATFNGAITLWNGFNTTAAPGLLLTDAKMSTIENQGTGTVTFNAAVQWNIWTYDAGTSVYSITLPATPNLNNISAVAGSGTSLVRNVVGGTINFTSSVTLSTSNLTATTATLLASDVDVWPNVTVENVGGGTLTFGQGITAAATSATNLATPPATFTRLVTVNVLNSGSGTLSFNGTTRGFVTNGSTGTINITGATTTFQVVSNASGGTIAVGANTWTWGRGSTASGSTSATTYNNAGTFTAGWATLTDVTGGSTFTSTTGGITISGSNAHSIQGGTFGNVTVSATGGTSFNTNPVTFTNFTASNTSATVTLATAVTATNMTFSGSGGTVAVNAALTVSGIVTVSASTVTSAGSLAHSIANFTQSGGTFTPGASTTVTITGNFNRTSGTVTNTSAWTLAFNSTSGQAFNGGPLLAVQTLTFSGIGNTVTFGQSVRAKDVTISAGTTVALGTLNIILNVASATMSNAGTYTASGGGGVVFGGTNTVSGGIDITGATFSASGTGTYSYLTIDVGALNSVDVSGTDTRFNGILTLKSGTLNVAAGANNFGPTGTTATIVRDVVLSPGITLGGGGATFNTAAIKYDLTYIGSLAADVSSGSELNANVRTWTVDVNSDPDADADDDISTGTVYYVEVAGNLAGTTDLAFAGALTINNTALVRVKADGTNGTNIKFDLTGTDVTHTINGRLTTAETGDWINISGANVNVIGSTVTGDLAQIGNVKIASTTKCTITSVQAFTGTFETLATSIVSLGMGSSTTTAATLAGEQIVSGAVTVGGSSLTLTSNIYSSGGVALNAGSLNFGVNNLAVTGGNFAQSAGTYTTGGGFLVMNGATNLTVLNTEAGALPNLRVLANTVLAAPGRVSGLLEIGDADAAPVSLTLFNAGAQDLTFTGSAITLRSDGTGTFDAFIGNNTVNGTADGALIVTSTAATISTNAAVRIEQLTYNPTGGAGTLTFAGNNTTARTFTIRDIFTHSAGEIALGKNHISFTGTGSAGATRAYVRSATTASGATVTATTGYFKFDVAATFTPGTGFSVPNLKVNGGLSNSTVTVAFTITGTLDLTTGTLTSNAGTVVLADGATIIRRAAAGLLSANPTFSGKVNVNYAITAATNANITTDREMPGTATALNNLTINHPDVNVADPYNIVLGKAITVTGTLYLVAGELDVATYSVTMADGSTINKGPGNFESVAAATDKPVVTNYNLVYSTGATITSTSKELQSGTGITVLSLQVLADASDPPVATTLILHANRTVGGLTLGGGSEIQLDNNAPTVGKLTVTGNVDLTGGTVTSAGVTGSELILAGTTTQTITVDAGGYALAKEVNLRLNNAAGFTLTGGNFFMSANATRAAGNTIYFVNGVLSTGANSIVLAQTTVGQGVDRSGVTGANVSHIAGKVRHSIPGGAGNSGTYANGRFEFPTGTATLYRPMAITFTSTYPAINPTNVDVSMVDESPAGRVGLPLDGGNSIRIGNYPAYFWLVATTPSSFSASQQFDVELQGTNLGFPFTSAGDLRIVRRQDGNADINPWQLQGTGASYQANYINVGLAGDSTIFVRSSSSLGGLVNQGSRFSIGIPTRPPVFTTAPPTASVDENALLTIQYLADPQDVGEGITYALVNPPTGAAINAATGVFTWTPTYTQSGSYTLTVSAFDGQFTVNTTTAVTVVNVNRKPDFAATGAAKLAATTIKDGQALAFTYIAVDIDGDAVTYEGVGLPTGATVSAAGVLAWTPTFAQAGMTHTITVVAKDASLTDTTSAVVTVNRSIARGDVDKNGTVGAADASLVLQHVAGITLITDAAALYAADASNNGSVSAYDAALILQAAAGLVTLPAGTDMSLGKTVAVDAVGSLSWASPEATREAGVVKVNLNIANAANVYAVQLTSKVDATLMAIEGVNAALPEGWEMMWNVVGNELRVAMAGATPLSSGSVAAIMVRLKNNESRLSFSTDAMLNENSQPLGAVEIAAVPTEFALQLNYPNPFNPSTTIKYQIAVDANVNLDIWNLQGQKIRSLVGKEQKAGYYSVVWDGRNEAGQSVSSGLYLYRVQAGSFVATHKMLMIK